MENLTQIDFQDIDEAKEYEEIIEKVVYECFKEEDLLETKLYMSIILTNKDKIQELNNTYRKIKKDEKFVLFIFYKYFFKVSTLSSCIETKLSKIFITGLSASGF